MVSWLCESIRATCSIIQISIILESISYVQEQACEPSGKRNKSIPQPNMGIPWPGDLSFTFFGEAGVVGRAAMFPIARIDSISVCNRSGIGVRDGSTANQENDEGSHEKLPMWNCQSVRKMWVRPRSDRVTREMKYQWQETAQKFLVITLSRLVKSDPVENSQWIVSSRWRVKCRTYLSSRCV